MSPALTFFAGLGLLVLFGWYFATDNEKIRRLLGTVLTIAITALCLASTYPPFDQKRPDGTVIASTTDGGECSFYDARTGKLLRRWPLDMGNAAGICWRSSSR